MVRGGKEGWSPSKSLKSGLGEPPRMPLLPKWGAVCAVFSTGGELMKMSPEGQRESDKHLFRTLP